MKKTLDDEIKTLTTNYASLKHAIQKFYDSKTAITDYGEKAANQDVLIPLTSSLYIPGKVDDNKSVLVEVGAGYFIEKSTGDATDYCERKRSLLSENAKKVAEIIEVKKGQANQVGTFMQAKMEEYQAKMAAEQKA
jgi:prefoldin alpha subunit